MQEQQKKANNYNICVISMLLKQRADLIRNTQSSSTARFPGNYSGRQYNGSWISPHPLIFRKYPLKHTVLFSHSQSLVCSVFALHGSSLHTKSMNSRGLFQTYNRAIFAKPSGAITRQPFSQKNLDSPVPYSLKIAHAGETLTGSFISSAAVHQCAKPKHLFSTHTHVHLDQLTIHHHNDNPLNNKSTPPGGATVLPQVTLIKMGWHAGTVNSTINE